MSEAGQEGQKITLAESGAPQEAQGIKLLPCGSNPISPLLLLHTRRFSSRRASWMVKKPAASMAFCRVIGEEADESADFYLHYVLKQDDKHEHEL